MAAIITFVLDYAAPVFLIASPVLSYADQIYAIHMTKTSSGFSMDIPLIMLVASIFKIFYWFGAYYSIPLLVQAVVMIAVQMVLLKIALDNRPQSGQKDGIEHTPFAGFGGVTGFSRPYDFWQWKTNRPYWMFLVYLPAVLLAVHVLAPPVSRSDIYISALGLIGLSVEAFLPVPQIISNQRARSCKGFRVSVLGAWLMGDTMKMGYFFFSGSSVPSVFRVCGVMQCMCDCYLGVQYFMYGNGQPAAPSHSRFASTSSHHGGEAVGMKENDVRMD